MKVHILVLGCLIFLSSCQNSTSTNLDKAVEKHLNAINSVEATTACTDVFTKSLETEDSEKFCAALTDRADGDFAVCEGDIRNPRFSKLISSCRSEVLKRLLKLESDRNKGLSVWANVYSEKSLALNFKFNTNVVKIDTSLGQTLVAEGLAPGQVVLTLDDGPDRVNTRSILRTLQEANVKAHFFQLGSRVKSNAELVRLMAREGHSIANHSWNHADFKTIGLTDAANQIYQTHKVIFEALGWVDPFFRFPYGSRSKDVEEVLKRNQMASFMWNVDSNDWRKINPDKTVRTNLQVIEDTMNQLAKRKKGILLFHDIHQRTAELMPELLKRLHQGGYQIAIYEPANTQLRTNPPILIRNPEKPNIP